MPRSYGRAQAVPTGRDGIWGTGRFFRFLSLANELADEPLNRPACALPKSPPPRKTCVPPTQVFLCAVFRRCWCRCGSCCHVRRRWSGRGYRRRKRRPISRQAFFSIQRQLSAKPPWPTCPARACASQTCSAPRRVPRKPWQHRHNPWAHGNPCPLRSRSCRSSSGRRVPA